MSETAYNPISQGPAIVQMQQYGAQQRIMPPQQKWCTPRRTKVIVAIVLITILYVIFLVAYAIVKAQKLDSHPY